MFERDHLSSFTVKIKALDGLNMWSSSKKTYVLNRSCTDLLNSPPKDEEYPFSFSIPVTYFNFLDSDKGEKFYSVLCVTFTF